MQWKNLKKKNNILVFARDFVLIDFNKKVPNKLVSLTNKCRKLLKKILNFNRNSLIVWTLDFFNTKLEYNIFNSKIYQNIISGFCVKPIQIKI